MRLKRMCPLGERKWRIRKERIILYDDYWLYAPSVMIDRTYRTLAPVWIYEVNL